MHRGFSCVAKSACQFINWSSCCWENAHFSVDCIFWTNATDAFIASNEKKHPNRVKETRWRSSPFDPLFCEHASHTILLIIFTLLWWPTRKCFAAYTCNNNVTNFNIFVNNSPHTHVKAVKKALVFDPLIRALLCICEHKKNSNCGLWSSAEKQLPCWYARIFIICLGSRAKKIYQRRAKGLEGAGRVNLKQFSGNTGDNGHSLYANQVRAGLATIDKESERTRRVFSAPKFTIDDPTNTHTKKSPSLFLVLCELARPFLHI